MPLPIKNFSATTEISDRSRVKLKSEKTLVEFWRQWLGDSSGGLSDDQTWAHDEVVAVVRPFDAFTQARDREGTPGCPVWTVRR